MTIKNILIKIPINLTFFFTLLSISAQESSLNSKINSLKEEFESVKIKVKKTNKNFLLTNFDVLISLPGLEIKDENNKVIEELKGVHYYYVAALSLIGSANVISFDIDDDSSDFLEIKNLKFLSEDKGEFIQNLSSFATGKQNSQEEGKKIAYSFGTLSTKTLSITMKEYSKDNTWKPILAELRVLNRNTKVERSYKILINTKAYNDFMKEINKNYSKNPIIKAKKFPIPVEK